MTPATVFIVDDDAAVRDGLSMLCEVHGLSVECHDSAESFLGAYQPAQQGCLVLDVRMGGMSGPELHAELRRRGSLLPVIYLSGHGDIPLSVLAMQAGAVNFLTKPVNSDELLTCLRRVLREGERRQIHALRLAELSAREQEVMALAIEGLSNKEIARRLEISHRTVEIHKRRVYQKTGTTSLLELARLAADHGSVDTR